MDIVTHALASTAVARALLPRAPKLLWGAVIVAGVIADADAISAAFGPATFLRWYRTYTHSIVAAVLFALITFLAYKIFSGPEPPAKISSGTVFLAALLASLLHVGMDACQWQGVQLFWPPGRKIVAADWLPTIDPWILSILIASLVLPELFHLVNAEIGMRERGPRGRGAASLGLLLFFFYIGARAALHSGAVAQLQARTFGGEPARRAAAFARPISLFTWDGLVDTENAVHVVIVKTGPGFPEEPQTTLKVFKPAPSSYLEVAQNTVAARLFLQHARFPKATVLQNGGGWKIEIRDLRDAQPGGWLRQVAAIVEINEAGAVTAQEIIWSKDTGR